ncbi:iron-sulfur cluster assembly scaffold protein [[Mycoplasma] falconis]|uniref:Iron-sulfur cluster assembly scaffold protein n=1 Tax=[Mycoplasma] falconis TaxID=92403 RepID=A0A501X963_9BACT|nr:iron-sulfur cluster assembly scaffold protein [[Mycoplasma] falconis]TPE57072.1 iron-sulfur cluster assembly scaffold protein [[Mycoplasma] falconis]
MASYNNQDKQKIIFSAYMTPKYKVNDLVDFDITEHSQVCVDDLKIKTNWEDNKLIEAKYQASGCAIFLASVDIMINSLINKSKTEINKILDLYFSMINLDNILQEDKNSLGELQVFENVKVHLNRLECASIIYRAMKRVVNG